MELLDHEHESQNSTALHRRLLRGFSQFMHTQSAGAVVMLVFTIVALVVANSDLWNELEEFWHLEAGVVFEGWSFRQSLLHWIDDALMATFFFVVGLEIKREIIVGELSSVRKAVLPFFAAFGGMLVPATIYWSINPSGAASRGWGVPMATDIAFALGVLAVLGSRVPSGLKVFLAALAIVDDIGAILVIAIFYTESIAFGWLVAALFVVAVMLLLNRLHVDSPGPYFALGVLLWFLVFNSGLHATIAGVIAAFTIPSRARISPLGFTEFARRKLDAIEACDVPGAHTLQDPEQQLHALEVRDAAIRSAAPLQRLEFGMHKFTTFFVLPLFALANAGVHVVGIPLAELLGPAALGIMAGLLVGKPLGILLFAWLAVRMGLSALPYGVTWRHVAGAGILGGIGFTMSIFVSGLAFADEVLIAEAKAAVLFSSVIAGLVGYAFLRLTPPLVEED